jgi:hypothetical protein
MENIQNQMKELFGNSCYAYCVAWLFDGARSIKDLTSVVLQGWYDGWIDNDGFVSKPVQYITKVCNKLSKVRDVVKVENIKKEDIPTVPTIVEMACPSGGSHFVVCHREGKNNIVLDFDPSGISNSWKAGNFIGYRRYVE